MGCNYYISVYFYDFTNGHVIKDLECESRYEHNLDVKSEQVSTVWQTDEEYKHYNLESVYEEYVIGISESIKNYKIRLEQTKKDIESVNDEIKQLKACKIVIEKSVSNVPEVIKKLDEMEETCRSRLRRLGKDPMPCSKIPSNVGIVRETRAR